MIIPDVNLLLYATIDAFGEHERARQWWEKLVNSGEPVGLADVVMFGYLRVSTNHRVLRPPLAVDQAVRNVESWLAQPNVTRAAPGPAYLETAFGFLRGTGTAGNLTTDVQIAAIAVENDATVCSNDTDFARFDGVRWVNPLAARGS